MEVSAAATVPPPPVAAITEPLVEVQQEVETTTSTPPPPESPAQSKEASDAAEVQPLPTEDEQPPSGLPPAAESQSPPAEAACKVRHCIDIHVRGLRRFVFVVVLSWAVQRSQVRSCEKNYFRIITLCGRNNSRSNSSNLEHNE